MSLLAILGMFSGPVHAASSAVPIIGVIPLAIFNISVSDIHETGATVTWNTNGDANSTVEYGLTASYGSVRTDPTMVFFHTMVLDGLSPGTVYHFRVISADQAGNMKRSADLQFTTTGRAPGPGGGGGGGWSGGIPLRGREAPYNCYITPVTGMGILTSGTFVSSVNGMADVRVSWSSNITEKPPAGANFITCIRSRPSDSTRSAFDAALASQGLRMAGLPYVMEVTKSHPVATGSAVIQMDVNRSWVRQSGGVNAVRIIRQGDNGSVQILETRFSNYALGTGYLNFRATSPGGLSVYAIIGVKAAPVPVPTVITPVTTAAVPAGTVVGPASTLFPIMISILAAIAIIVIGLVLQRRAERR